MTNNEIIEFIDKQIEKHGNISLEELKDKILKTSTGIDKY